MGWIPSLTSWPFFLAGLACAFGPIIIHLLNRRRYRVVQWAAMDFLREALQRNRRMLQIRDLILLALRTAAVFLFGLALAQPFFTRGFTKAVNDRAPVHAIVVIDNSLSMGYEGLDGTLLEKAKDRARRLIDQLPAGSKISVLPACGTRDGYSPDPYDTEDGALEALSKIELVDRSTSFQQVANMVQKASESAPELTKRVVVFSDQQASNWRGLDSSADDLKKLTDWQVVAVAPSGSSSDWENTWISEIEVADGLADIETPTTITVKLQHQGGVARQDVQVKLSYGDTVIGEKTVSIEPGPGFKEVPFEYIFNTLNEIPEPDRPVFVPLKAEVEANDSLAADNVRYLALPIVAGLPVVFVDQYGPTEDPNRGRLGETRHLRKLLAPKTSRADAPRQLVKVRHLTQDELSQEILQDARLVVIAGLKEPQSEGTVELLRDYVRQGGRLVIAAGADFDAARWQELAWRDGDGILPLPLRETIGEVPELAGKNARAFEINFDSLRGDELFQLPETGEDELKELYEEAVFFKVIGVDSATETVQALQAATRKRLEEELNFRFEVSQRREEFAAKQAAGQISAAELEQQKNDELKLAEIQPNWLTWAAAQGASSSISVLAAGNRPDEPIAADPEDRAKQIDRLLIDQAPRVLAELTEIGKADSGHVPLLVAQQKGRGEVLFVSSGLLSTWNTLPTTNAILIFDRLLRTMTRSTLASRNFAPMEQLTLPVPPHEHDLAVMVTRPRQLDPEPLDVGFIGNDRRGVTLHGLYQRGVYRVTGFRRDLNAEGAQMPDEKPVWEVPIVVNGDPEESELEPLTRERFEKLTAGTTMRWIEPGEEISLGGAAIRGQQTWWYVAVAVLFLLLAEMLVLAWPALKPAVG
jgi:hypothetical protein